MGRVVAALVSVLLAASACAGPRPSAPTFVPRERPASREVYVVGFPQTKLSPRAERISRCAATSDSAERLLDCIDPERTLSPPTPTSDASLDGAASEADVERAKALYMHAEALAASGRWFEALPLYVEAYWLVPGKHGFAHKIGVAAWYTRDCDTAKVYLEHFLRYASADKHGDKLDEAKAILGEIAITGCATR